MHNALLSFLILKNKLPCICLSLSLIPLSMHPTGYHRHRSLSPLSTMHLCGHHGHFSLSRSFSLPLTMHLTGHNKSLSLFLSSISMQSIGHNRSLSLFLSSISMQSIGHNRSLSLFLSSISMQSIGHNRSLSIPIRASLYQFLSASRCPAHLIPLSVSPSLSLSSRFHSLRWPLHMFLFQSSSMHFTVHQRFLSPSVLLFDVDCAMKQFHLFFT